MQIFISTVTNILSLFSVHAIEVASLICSQIQQPSVRVKFCKVKSALKRTRAALSPLKRWKENWLNLWNANTASNMKDSHEAL